MKKSGFTLMELLVVIIVLSIIMTIAIPIILNINNTLNGKITAQEEKNIKEAANLIGLDLDDYTSNIYNCKNGSWIETKCTMDTHTGIWSKVEVKVSDMVSHNYFNDKEKHCSGTVTIKKESTRYEISFSNVSC